MDKKEVQQRVLRFGKPLALDEFSWDEKTKTFSSLKDDLVIAFSDIDNCTFDTGNNCTFDTGSDCTFKTGFNCAIVNRNVFEVILSDNNNIQICPDLIPGHIRDGIYSVTNKPAIIADNILSEIISKKEKDGITIYKVINHREEKQSYLIEVDGVYSHGRTLKEAKESYKYKIANRDTGKYDNLTLESELNDTEAIKLYRIITGACESGTKYFVENLKDKPEKLSIKELINLTKGQFNHESLVKFFEGKE